MDTMFFVKIKWDKMNFIKFSACHLIYSKKIINIISLWWWMGGLAYLGEDGKKGIHLASI